MINTLSIFFAGLIGLWLGSELLVRAAMKVSKSIGLSETFIGLTLLALGTDFPEIMVSLTGAIEKTQGVQTDPIIIGNIIGSNMGQIALVLGISGLLRVYKIEKKQVLHNGLMLVISTFLMIMVSIDGRISRTDGLIFIIFYLAYFFTLKRTSKTSKIKKKLRKKNGKNFIIFALVQLAVGLFVISEASEVVIEKGLLLAEILGMSKLLVGVILIGIGTSLPEMVVSLTAIIRGSNGLSVGNLIGSNIVDILIALGGGALISGWVVEPAVVQFDMAYLLLTSIVVVLFLITREVLERKESFLILGLYAVYLSLKIFGW